MTNARFVAMALLTLIAASAAFARAESADAGWVTHGHDDAGTPKG